MTTDSIQAIMVELDVDGSQSLFIVLANDGLVNRLGTGEVDNKERVLCIGRTRDPLFVQLREKVQPEWIEHQVAYDIPEKTGRTCTLMVLFKYVGGREAGVKFRYGSESQGPPADICQFVAAAIRLTDPWYEIAKRQGSEQKEAKPWWKFW